MWYSESKLELLFRTTSQSQSISTPTHFHDDLRPVTIDRIERIEIPGFLEAAKIVFHEDDLFNIHGLLKYIVFTYKEKWNLTQLGVQQEFENGLNVPILFGRIHLFVENFLNGLKTQNYEYSPLTVPLDLVSVMFRINEETGDGEIIIFPTEDPETFVQFIDSYNSETWPNGKEKKTKISLFHVGQYASPHTGQELPKILPSRIVEQPQSGTSIVTNFSGHQPQIYTMEGIGVFFKSKFELEKEEFIKTLNLFPIVWEKEVTNDFRIYTGYKMNFYNDIFPKTNENYRRLLKKWYFAYIKNRAVNELQSNPTIDMHISINIDFIDKNTLQINFEGALH